MSLCKYKNILGKPNEGAHKHFLGIAITDVVFTIILAVIIWKITKIGFWIILLSLFLLGIILHRIFCVNTTINKLIFGKVE
jgi:hypothetical protein